MILFEFLLWLDIDPDICNWAVPPQTLTVSEDIPLQGILFEGVIWNLPYTQKTILAGLAVIFYLSKLVNHPVERSILTYKIAFQTCNNIIFKCNVIIISRSPDHDFYNWTVFWWTTQFDALVQRVTIIPVSHFTIVEYVNHSGVIRSKCRNILDSFVHPPAKTCTSRLLIMSATNKYSTSGKPDAISIYTK